MITYTRLFADRDGESHFADIEVELLATNYAPPAPPLNLSSFTPATQFGFLSAPAGWSSDWHPSSARNIFFVLTGEWEVTASDGEVRRFPAGSVLRVEDTTGKGHSSRVLSQTDSLAAVVQLARLVFSLKPDSPKLRCSPRRFVLKDGTTFLALSGGKTDVESHLVGGVLPPHANSVCRSACYWPPVR
jgi:hypothetical protein